LGYRTAAGRAVEEAGRGSNGIGMQSEERLRFFLGPAALTSCQGSGEEASDTERSGLIAV